MSLGQHKLATLTSNFFEEKKEEIYNLLKVEEEGLARLKRSLGSVDPDVQFRKVLSSLTLSLKSVWNKISRSIRFAESQRLRSDDQITEEVIRQLQLPRKGFIQKFLKESVLGSSGWDDFLRKVLTGSMVINSSQPLDTVYRQLNTLTRFFEVLKPSVKTLKELIDSYHIGHLHLEESLLWVKDKKQEIDKIESLVKSLREAIRNQDLMGHPALIKMFKVYKKNHKWKLPSSDAPSGSHSRYQLPGQIHRKLKGVLFNNPTENKETLKFNPKVTSHDLEYYAKEGNLRAQRMIRRIYEAYKANPKKLIRVAQLKEFLR